MSEKQPQPLPESNEADQTALEASRNTPKWKELFRDNLSHIRKSNPGGITSEGEPITEDWLLDQATEMADKLYKMKMKQQEIDKKNQILNEYPTTLNPASRAELEEQAKSTNPAEADAAKRVLRLFDENAEE